MAPRGGVLAGFSAAEPLGRGCALHRVPAEVLVPRDARSRPDLLVRRGTHFTDFGSRADRRSDLTLADHGWHTMRLTNDDVDDDPPVTRQRVAAQLHSRTPTSTPVHF